MEYIPLLFGTLLGCFPQSSKFLRWMASYLEREGLKPPTRLNRPQTAPAMRTSGAARGIG